MRDDAPEAMRDDAPEGFIAQTEVMRWPRRYDDPREFISKFTGVPAENILDFEIEQSLLRYGWQIRRLRCSV